MESLKMRKTKILRVLIFIVLVFECVTNATSPSEDVLRELHSKLAKYNKDLRYEDKLNNQNIILKLQAQLWRNPCDSWCQCICSGSSRCLR